MKITAIYSFGSPRVLSPVAAAYAESTLPAQIFRHAGSGDVVPEIVAKHPEGREEQELYDHAGWIAFHEQDELHFGPGPWSRAKEVLRHKIEALVDLAPVMMRSHRMARYQSPIYEEFRKNPLPRLNGWSPAAALACARAARLSYQGPVRQLLPFLGFEQARLVPGLGVEALVILTRPMGVGRHSYGIVAFRSVEPEDPRYLEDWIAALEQWRKGIGAEQVPWFPGAPGSTREDWLREVVEIETALKATVRRICGTRPLLVTGHGKGGAQALVWAIRRIEEERRGKIAAAQPPAEVEEAEWPVEAAMGLPWEPRFDPDSDWRNPLSYEELGSRIRMLRESHGLTQAELAARVGREPSDLSRVEKGGEEVSLEAILAILAELDVSLSELFDDARVDSVTPADVKMMDMLKRLPKKDRAAVLSLVRFKRVRKDWEEED